MSVPPPVLVTVVTDAFHVTRSRQVSERPWRAGAPLADYLPRAVTAVSPESVLVSLNGASVPPETWTTTPVRPGDGVLAVVVPGAGTVVALAITACQIAYNYYDGRRKSKVAARRAEAARIAAELEASLRLGFTGVFPTTQPGSVIPVLYGRMRVAGHCVFAQQQRNSARKNVLSMTCVVSHGEVEGMVAGTIQINGQPLANFPGASADTQVGTNTQSASTVVKPMLAATTRNTPGNALATGGAAVLYVTQPLITGFRVQINFPNGLYAYRTTRNSVTGIPQKVLAAAEATFTVRIRSYPSGAFGAAVTFKTGFQVTAQPFAIQYVSGPIAADRYEIEVKHTADTAAARFVGTGFESTCALAVVEEYQEVTPVYPNLATLNLLAVASNALSGALPVVTAVWEGRKVPVWNNDDPATFTDTYTRNPAWIIYDLLTNTLYGAGNYIATSEIDLDAFAAAAAFCDALVNTPDGGTEARSVCDFYLDADMGVLDAVGMIAAAAGLQIIRGFGKIKLIPDATGTAVQCFGMGNIVKDSYKHTFLSGHNVPNRVSVQFLNADQDYHQDVAQTEDPLVLVNGETFIDQELEAIGVTRITQATRIAKRTFLQARYQREQIEFEVGADALALEWGDVFIFLHENTRPGEFFSGRVLPGSSTTQIKLDQPIRVPVAGAGEATRLYVRYLGGPGNDTQEQSPVQLADQGQVTDLITLESPQAFTYAPAVGDLYALAVFGTVYEERKFWKVVEITRTQAHRRKVVAIPYRLEAYADADIDPADIVRQTDYATPS